MDESLLTGESKPTKKDSGDKVIAGSVNGKGAIKVKVTHTGGDLYLSKVIKLVQEEQTTKSKTQNLANKAAKWLTYVSITLGLVTLITWMALGKDISFVLERMVTVMVITCPHALGLAVPLVVAISTTLSAQNGLLIRNRIAFENVRKITTLVFDKTGTLTKGNFEVLRYQTLNKDYTDEEILKIAASVEQSSEHPLSAGIIKLAKEKNITLGPIKNFQEISGYGISADYNDQSIKIVSPQYLLNNNIQVPSNLLHSFDATTAIILINNKVSGYFELGDEIREESFAAIKTFKKNGIKTLMLTGDNQAISR